MFLTNKSRGFTFIGILLALVIVMILGGHYFKKDEESQKRYVETQLDKSKDAACAANRNVLESGISSWMISHPGEKPTLEKLRRDRVSAPKCPEGPEYIFDDKGNVYCPIHYPPPGSESRGSSTNDNRSPSAPAASTLDRVNRQLGR